VGRSYVTYFIMTATFEFERFFQSSAHIECVTVSDEQSEMIIFESILTTFKLSFIFEAAG